MKKKLTLSINDHVLEKAKNYANQTGRSLSEIVESYLTSITEPQLDQKEDNELNQIIGIIELPNNFDDKKLSRQPD